MVRAWIQGATGKGVVVSIVDDGKAINFRSVSLEVDSKQKLSISVFLKRSFFYRT